MASPFITIDKWLNGVTFYLDELSTIVHKGRYEYPVPLCID